LIKKKKVTFTHRQPVKNKKKESAAPENGDVFENETIEFPITFAIKIIMESGDSNEESKKQSLKQVFDKLSIPNSGWKSKLSGKGNYISFTALITVKTKEEMHNLYSELKTVPGVKYAI